MTPSKLARRGFLFRRNGEYFFTASGLRVALGVEDREWRDVFLRRISLRVRRALVKAWGHEPEVGCCGIAGHVLACVLLHQGVRAEVVWGLFRMKEPHLWVETSEFLLDVAARQFGGAAVVVRKKKGSLDYHALKRGEEVDRYWGQWDHSPCKDPKMWEGLIQGLG